MADTIELLPLDFEALRKGDVIDRSRIERAYGPEMEFWQKQIRLCGEIEKNRSDLLPCSRKNTIVIMSDREADDRLWDRVHKATQALARNAARRVRIDRRDFSLAERRVAEHRDTMSGLIAAKAMKDVRAAEQNQRMLAEGKDATAPELEAGE